MAIGIGAGQGSLTELPVVLDPPGLDLLKTNLIGFGSPPGPLKHQRSLHVQYASVANVTPSRGAKHPTSGTDTPMLTVPAPMRVAWSMEKTTSVSIGTRLLVALTSQCGTTMNSLAVETQLTALRTALSQRRHTPLTPLNANSWEHKLISSDLISKYQQIPMYIQLGAFAGIPQIDLVTNTVSYLKDITHMLGNS